MMHRYTALLLMVSLAGGLSLAPIAAAQVAVRTFPSQKSSALRSSEIGLPMAERKSALRPVIVGALLGAAAGTVLTFASSECRSGYSMCGLALPIYAGGGALVGGLAGYVWSLRR